jgi:hypothetical protein
MSSVDWSDTDAPQYFEAKKMKQPAETIGETINETLGSVSGYARDMTLRDYFAGLAMQVWLKDKHRDFSNIALISYMMADGMIKERSK